MFWLGMSLVIIAYWFFRSPLAQAAAEAIRHANGVPGRDRETDQAMARVTEDVNALRDSLMELAERVDFTERALADVRRRDQLPPRA